MFGVKSIIFFVSIILFEVMFFTWNLSLGDWRDAAIDLTLIVLYSFLIGLSLSEMQRDFEFNERWLAMEKIFGNIKK
jgi:hypothetical protein